MNAAPQRLGALFLDMLAAERGAAANTLQAYRRDLDDYFAFLAEAKVGPLAAGAATIRAFMASLDERGLKASSAARRLSAVRQFHKFLYAEGYAGADPTAAVEGPKRGRALPKVLSVDHVDRLLGVAKEAAENADASPAERLRGARMHCLLELLYASGLRVSELVALPKAAALAKDRVLIIRGKGGRERLVPLTEAARSAARAYLALLQQQGRAAGAWLFPADSEAGHLTRQAFARDLKAAAAAAGLRTRQDQSACAPPRLRQPPPAERGGPAHRPGASRPRRHLDDTDLHARARRAPQEHGARPAPARRSRLVFS